VHKNRLKLSFKTSVLAAALAALPIVADAAGMGRITVLSALGQPLRAEVELSASREELSSLSARIAGHEAFKQAGIEFVPALAAHQGGGGQAFRRTAGDPPDVPTGR
jgi:pilus assembly protein FimV